MLEIGAGYGGGSTWCLAQGLRASIRDPCPARPVALYAGAVRGRVGHAAATLRRLPVTVMRCAAAQDAAAAASAADAADPGAVVDGDSAEGGGPGRPPGLAAVLRRLCERFAFDVVVVDVDGGEPVGPAAYEAIESLCQPRELVLRGVGGGAGRLKRLLEGSPGRWAKSRYGMDDLADWAVYKSLVAAAGGGG